jgi:biopolymer transport protein ExbD
MIIPMIDIIFFLLVFFMMSTMYMIEQKVLPVVLPTAGAAQSDTRQTIPVTVLANGTLHFGEQVLTEEQLPAGIRAALAQNAETGFVVRADRTVPYGQVVTVLDRLRQAGVSRLTIAVEPRP